MTACFPNLGVTVQVYDSRDAAPASVKNMSVDGDPTAVTFNNGRPQLSIFVDRYGSQADVINTMNDTVLANWGVDQIIGKPALQVIGDRIVLESVGATADPELKAVYDAARQRLPRSSPLGLTRAVLADIGRSDAAGAGINRVMAGTRAAMETAGIVPPSGRLTALDLRAMMAAVDEYARARPNSPEAAAAAYRAKQASDRLLTAPDKAGNVQHTVDGSSRILGNWFTNLGVTLGDDRNPLLNLQRLVIDRLRDTAFGRSRLWALTQTLANKGQNAMGLTRHKFYDPVFKIMREEGRKLGQRFDEVARKLDHYVNALHAGERNERMWAMKVELQDDAALRERAELLDDAARRGRKWADYRAELFAIVTPHAKVPLRDARYSGMTTAEATEYLKQYDADPQFAAARAALSSFQAARDQMIRDKVASGVVPQAIIDLYGYENYVPQRGRHIDPNALPDAELHKAFKLDNETINDLASVRRVREASGRGDQGEAQDTFNTVIYDGLDAARLRETQSLLQEVGRTFTGLNNAERPLFLGRVIEDGAMTWDAKGSRFISEGLRKSLTYNAYNAIPFMDADGRTKTLVTHDERLARTLSDIAAPKNKLSKPAQAITHVTSRYGQILTRFNPYFWPVQFGRDYLNNMTTLLFHNVGIRGFDRFKAMTAFSGNLAATLADTRLRDFMFASGETARADLLLDPAFRDQRSLFADFVDDGARTRITNQYAEIERHRFEGVRENARQVAESFTRVQEGLEIAHRYAYYKTLRDMGIEREPAAQQTVDLMDFSQRSAASRAFNTVYPFSHVINAAFSRFAGEAIWKDGRPPVKITELPGGDVQITLDWATVPQALNIPAMIGMVLAGVLGSQMMDGALGEDDEGIPIYAKQAPSTMVRNFMIPGLNAEEPLSIPLPENMAGMFFALGALADRAHRGYDDGDATAYAMLNAGLFYAAPVGKGNLQINDVPGSDSFKTFAQDVAVGYTGIAAPAVRSLVLGRDMFGLPIDKTGTNANIEGASVELRGGAATTPSGEPYRGALTDMLGVSGDVGREIFTSYFGWPASVWDRWTQADVRSVQQGDPELAMNPVRDLIAPLFGIRPSRSGHSYGLRMKNEAEEPFADMMVTASELAEEDRNAGEGGQLQDGRRSRGPRLDAYLKDEPALNYYIDHTNMRKAEEHGDEDFKESGSYSQQIAKAQAQGDYELTRQLVLEREQRTEEDARTYTLLWKARAEWIKNGSKDGDFMVYARREGLNPVKARKRR